jgi:NAD(P)-dependent dehydrogenase (short-subunit alcohol dehydrogenase family)
MSTRPSGKVAVVFGAGSSGVALRNGRAAAFAFAREGALVAAIDRNRAEAELSAREITRQGGTAQPFTADVTCEDDVHATVDGLSVRAT